MIQKTRENGLVGCSKTGEQKKTGKLFQKTGEKVEKSGKSMTGRQLK